MSAPSIQTRMECRPACGACCIAPSITQPLSGMPDGKLAGERCINLGSDLRCNIWGSPDYPEVCRAFRAEPDSCGNSRVEAMRLIGDMEHQTR